ncbi:S46 family peptidase [Solitalea koreensis]|nr:S46 family peptidase [Solitalea koreensis]
MNFKKLLLLVLTFIVLGNEVKADEGMWLPMLIHKNYDEMKKQGFKLTPKDIYDVNNASLKDAIVWFNGGCTGEVVSQQGLLLTNHHCGYEAIAANSTPQDNILDNGWYAKTQAEEKPIEGMWVSFLVRMEDVTDQVNAALKGVDATQRASKIAEVSKEIAKKAAEGTSYDTFVKDMFKGNQYFLFVMQKYTDIRLVGAPPQSVGKYGGDTDNWVWPRHTGDFSVFRIYANKENKPATFAKDNVPFKPKKALNVSMNGVKEGDFSMVFGYPGRTNRYESSNGVQLAIDKVNPAIVKLRDIRLKAWKEQMDKSDSVRLLLSSQYAQIANYWKYYIGQTEQIKHLKVVDYKKAQEVKFQQWAAGKAEYADLFSDWTKAYTQYSPYAAHPVYISQGIFASSAVSFARTFASLDQLLRMGNAADISKSTTGLKDQAVTFFKSFNLPSDKKILASELYAFYTDIPKDQHPALIDEILSKYGEADPEASFKKFADDVFATSIFASKDKTMAFLANPTSEALSSDPLYNYVNSFILNYRYKYAKYIDSFNGKNEELGRMYAKGILEMNSTKNMYPDANSTLRLTYGQVQAYSPKDAVSYNYVTTIDGVMEKYNPGDFEFDLPKKYIDLYNKKDFGRFTDKNGKLVVAFISNNDITGGNSGSPVLNGNGELIGLAFDGNWEAMSGDIVFDKKYKRTIVADIRYVLWCIEKLGDAPHIVNEMKLVSTSTPVKGMTKAKK